LFQKSWPVLRLSRFAVVSIGLSSVGLLSQNPSSATTTSTDCSDPVMSGSAACVQQLQVPAAQALPAVTSQSGESNSSPGVYVDRAGSARTAPIGQNVATFRQQPPPTDLQRLAQQSTGEQLPLFGRNLFDQAPSSFVPNSSVPVPSDYVIAPGDEVLVRLWGGDTLNAQLTVDKTGAIFVPRVGSIQVAGLRFDQLQTTVHDAVARVFRNFDLAVTLGSLRSLQVYVVGEALHPGAFTISSLSTAINALVAAGGPNAQGSMRRIEVRRGGKVVTTLDLYDLILRGDKTHDIRLQAEDIIFIPQVGPQVAIAGSVNHPAIFELLPDTTLEGALSLAGGLAPTASQQSLRLERIVRGQERESFDLAQNAPDLRAAARNGDVLYVPHIEDGYQNSVTLRGNLANPGRFAWHPGMKLSDILPDRMSLLTPAYWGERNRLGVPTPLFEPLPPLQTQGSDSGASASTQGFGVPNSSMTSGLQNTAPTRITTTASDAANQNGENSNRGSVAEHQQEASLGLVGARGQGVTVTIPTPEIDWSYAVIERLDPQTLRNVLVPFHLGRLVQDHDPSQNLPLQPGDVVTIFSQADIHVGQDQQTKYIRLEGEFISPGVYSVAPGETLRDLVQRAGGLTSKAYLYGASFTRESARVEQQARLDVYIDNLSIDQERASAKRSISGSVPDVSAVTQQQLMISQLRQLRATGRIVLEFRPGSQGADSVPAIPLENGDVFRVSSQPATVGVIGSVYGQNVFLYSPKRHVADYLRLAGNATRVADHKHAFVIRADGSILSREYAHGVFSNTFDGTPIYPGDTIVVPEKELKPSALRSLTDYTSIISSVALTGAVLASVQ
jgi:polysaccharide biosynthesis/export protein